MKDNLLEVGDVIYSRCNGKILDKFTISRVSPKIAYAKMVRDKFECSFNRKLNNEGYTRSDNYLLGELIYLETQELKDEWECKHIIEAIDNIMDKLSVEKLRMIKDFLNKHLDTPIEVNL
jgi:hypothetical protein